MNIKQSSLLMPSAGENFFPDKNMVIPSLENMNHIFIDNISFKNREDGTGTDTHASLHTPVPGRKICRLPGFKP
ncbi:hypothetical protein [Akkermansia sp.]|uniref:hypothetical protein n=1 Tax=Akkermansia sp. TaxID=1872421 RepID=UPI003AB8858A